MLIGGGLLGLEAGNGLRKAGLAVTVGTIFKWAAECSVDRNSKAGNREDRIS